MGLFYTVEIYPFREIFHCCLSIVGVPMAIYFSAFILKAFIYQKNERAVENFGKFYSNVNFERRNGTSTQIDVWWFENVDDVLREQIFG